MADPKTILFLCPHGAAKSLLAATYFDRLAQQRGLCLRAAFAGTEPNDELSPRVVAALRAEGIDVPDQRPRRVGPEDLAGAYRVISIGAELGDVPPPGLRVERWDDIPSASQDLDTTRAAVRRRLTMLMDDLERE